MNTMNMKMMTAGLALAALCLTPAMAEYNVRRPAESFKPAWTGARAGQWTMDYEAALANAGADGKCTVMLVSGSWWCPHCEAFEEKVLLSDEWKSMVSEQGYYLTLLDFPYRGTVKDEELSKSIHPELGPGWGFQCWLYDADYLAENGLTVEDGLREIEKRYRLQKELADESAAQVTIQMWDGSGEFTYGKVGYPTLIVFLPDGTEAGRFVPFVTYMEPAEAREYVLEQVDAIVTSALNAQCGLCSDPEEGGLEGAAGETYLGYLNSAEETGVAGTVSVKVSKRNNKGKMTLKATVAIAGKRVTLKGATTNGYETVTLVKNAKTPFKATLRFGTEGLSGTYTDGVTTYAVTGARNAFIAKDAAAKARTAAYETGAWNLAMAPVAGAPAMAGGYGSLTVTLKAKGKAKVSGRLADGTRVNVNAQAIPGDDGILCVPVDADLYSKKGGFSCVLWFREGVLFNVTDIGEWTAAGKTPFVTGWKALFSGRPGFSGTDPEMELVFASLPSAINGLEVVSDPDLDEVSVTGTKWKGSPLSWLSATCNPKTGVVSGKLTFVTLRENGKEKKVKADVTGVVIDGKAYCSVLVKKNGSWAAKVLSCAECDE